MTITVDLAILRSGTEILLDVIRRDLPPAKLMPLCPSGPCSPIGIAGEEPEPQASIDAQRIVRGVYRRLAPYAAAGADRMAEILAMPSWSSRAAPGQLRGERVHRVEINMFTHDGTWRHLSCRRYRKGVLENQTSS